MTTIGAAPRRAPIGVRVPRLPVIAVRTARQSARTGLLWGAVYLLYVAGSASGYAASYPTSIDRQRLSASFGSNAGLSALLGQARRLDTVAGFTAWRTLGTLSIIGPIWGLLLATRLTRGEEDTGRWELYLCGATTRRSAAGQAILSLLAAPVVVWAVTALGTAVDGRSADVRISAGQSAYLALALVMPAVLFLGIGALLGQLCATRRQASTATAAILGASFLARLLADSGTGLQWLRRVSPLGWAEQQHPLTGSNPAATGLLAVAATACLAGAVQLAGRRDLGSSVLPDRTIGRGGRAGLGGPVRFAMRQSRGLAVGWLVAVASTAAVGGLVSKAAAGAITGNATVQQALQRLGARPSGALAYLGIIFLTIAALAGFAAAALGAAIRAEESEGHLDQLLAAPLARVRWLAGRIVVALGALVAIVASAAAGSWAGAASQHTGAGFGDLVRASVNVLPAALFVLGASVCCFGLAPRYTALLGYGVIAWAFLIELIGSAISLNHWLIDTSLLAHLTAVPAASPDWTSGGWLLLLAAGLALTGVAAFSRRDLVGD